MGTRGLHLASMVVDMVVNMGKLEPCHNHAIDANQDFEHVLKPPWPWATNTTIMGSSWEGLEFEVAIC